MGRKTCAVKSCSSNHLSPGITFHKFPTDGSDGKQWTDFLVKVNGDDDAPKNAFICSLHFKNCCISSEGLKRTRVIPGHVPTLDSDCCVTKRSAEPMPVVSINYEEECAKLTGELKSTKAELVKMKALYKKAMDELRVLKQFRNRKRKVMEQQSESTTSKQLKPDKAEGEEELVVPQQILQKMFSLAPQRSYDDFVKDFAYELHFHSPRAYWFVRELFGKSLPHPRTFGRWTQHVITAPGFLEISLSHIEQRVLSYSHQLYFSLMLDEVSIRKQIVFDNQSMKGYVNYGGIVERATSDSEAKSALFVLACEVNGTKKIPIGYILTNGLDSNLMAEVVNKSLIRMADKNAKVISITFDGLSANFSAMEKLGASLDFQKGAEELVTYIRHPTTGAKVFIFPDPSHMFKLMRNKLKHFGTLYNEHDQAIHWNYLAELVTLQTETGLRAGNKLTNRHVSFENQKMKVKLCTQLFSNSVSVALNVCRKLQIPEFVESEATSEFLELMNRLFDALNSKPTGKGYKAPLRISNRRFWQSLFEKAQASLLQLKYKTQHQTFSPVLKSKHGTFIKGLVIGMKSLQTVMNEIVAQPDSDLEYLPVYKLSQDMLELFFSVLRSRFGFNNNPNVQQLEQGLRSILCCNLKPGLRGNALAQDETTTRISALGSTKALSIAEDEIYEETWEDDEIPSIETLTPFFSNIVVYIAGYVGRALVSKVKCSSCLLAVLPDDSARTRPDFVLLNEKDNGGLFAPNSDLIEVCRITEVEIRRSIPRDFFIEQESSGSSRPSALQRPQYFHESEI